MQCTGAEALIRSLLAEGVEVVFGYPGGAVLPIYDWLVRYPDLRHVLTRHEQGAIHAAEGYAKATGRVGVVLVTSGPGATNLVTGLCDALMDSVPLVAITGQVPLPLLGRDAFQEADITGITMPVTKHNYLVKRPQDVPRIIKEAFHIARTGRPGPVLVDIPKDVAYGNLQYSYPETVHLPGYRPEGPGLPQEVVERAAGLLAGASRPVLICGGGVVTSPGAPERLVWMAERLHAPVTCTLQGLGGFPAEHPMYMGMLGMHGTYAANRAVHNADVLLACGMRFDDRVTGKLEKFAPHARIIHLDIDPAEVAKNIPTYMGLIGDAARILARLREAMGEVGKHAPDSWREQIRQWHYQYPTWLEKRRTFRVPVISPEEMEEAAVASLTGQAPAPQLPKPQDVVRAIQTVFGPESVLCVDVGQHQMWAAHFCTRNEPRSWLSSSGLGTMGFGLPAAVGAQIARPEKQVVLICGEGGFNINIQELATIAAHNLPVRIMLINNGYLGMVRQWQEMFYEQRLSYVDNRPGMPEFTKLAEAYGIRGLLVNQAALVPWAVMEASQHPGPILVEFQVIEDEKVFPMVPPGEANERMLMQHDPEGGV